MNAGSVSTGSTGSAVYDAALKLKAKLTAAGASTPDSYTRVVAQVGVERITAEGEFAPPPEAPSSLFSFGAMFVEVRVDAEIPIRASVESSACMTRVESSIRRPLAVR